MEVMQPGFLWISFSWLDSLITRQVQALTECPGHREGFRKAVLGVNSLRSELALRFACLRGC